ncbi:DUF4190 domain-containing protein [uncultured Leifsonia sp.]|uniref:DUF4190 domain-containing protein n=1 Tax=uncultured Leifsonia sp. TaxID=340359 RepID=UPI0028D020FF|nr:DUF4190 domain-containing protein [uncultured Leifsonia sp.]
MSDPYPPAQPPSPPYPPQGYAGQPYPAPYGYAQAPRTNTLAIVSLVSAFVVSIVAVITGHIALAQIRRTGEAGRGMALAGLIIGYVGVGFTVLVFAIWLITFISIVTYSTSVSGVAS